MEAGAVNIKFMADILDLQSKMKTAQDTVGSTMKGMETAIGYAKNALIAFTGIASVSAFVGMIKGSIDATGALHDMAIQTGASEAALAEFRKMGAYTETSAETIGSAINKLSKNLLASSEEGKGAGVAIKALGLDYDSFMKLSPEQRMIEVAKAMNNFADGADKGAAAQLLFGKEGANLLPFLKDLGTGAEEVNTALTAEQIELKKTQAAMADAFGDNLIQIRKESDGWKRDLATGMTPALYEASQAFIEVTTQSGGLKEEISNLSRDGTIAEWTRMAITGITYLMDAFSGLKAVVITTGQGIGYMAASAVLQFSGIATAISQIMKGEFAAAADTFKNTTAAQKQMTEDFHTTLDKTWGAQTLGSQLRDRMADMKNMGIESEASKPKLDLQSVLAANKAATEAAAAATKAAAAEARAQAAETKKQEDAYLKLNSSIDEQIAQMKAEIEGGQALTAMQKVELDFITRISNGILKMAIDRQDEIKAKLQSALATETLMTAYRAEVKQLAENNKENAASIEAIQTRTKSIMDEKEKQIETNIGMVLGKDAMEALSIAKMYDTAATLERKAAVLEAGGPETAMSEALREQAKILRERADLAKEGAVVKEAVEAQKAWEATTKAIGDGLSSALTDALMNGRSLWDAFKAWLINSILEGAIKNALSSVIQAGLNSMFGTTLFSAAGTAVGTGAAGSGLLAGAGTALGVGTSAGVGVTATGIAGGGAGAAVGVDLGAAGAGTAGAGAGLGVIGTSLAAAAAVIIIGDMIKQSQRPFELVGSQAVPGMTDQLSREQETFSGWMTVPIHAIEAQKLRFPDDGSIMYQMMGDGIPIEAVNATALTQRYGIPAFAQGTDFFGGGWRLVGERGPELEATGASRIYNADQTRDILSGGSELLTEIRGLRADLAVQGRSVALNTQKMSRMLDKWDVDGQPEVRVA